MRLFGFRIRIERVQPKQMPSVYDAYNDMCRACNALTEAWRRLDPTLKDRKPWIDWHDKKIVISLRHTNGSALVVYDPDDGQEP